MKFNKLSIFGIFAFISWAFIAEKWLRGLPIIEASSFFFYYDMVYFLILSSILFFISLYIEFFYKKNKKDKFIGSSLILILFGLFFSIFDGRIGNIFFIGILLFLYSIFFIKKKNSKRK